VHLAFSSPVVGDSAAARAVVLHGPVDVDAHMDDPWKHRGNTARCTVVNQITGSSRVGAGDSPKCHVLVLGHGGLYPFLQQLNEHANLSMLRNATQTLSNFCHGKP
jgi:hypothetical protein